jgi:hypothetical protein
VHFTFTPAAKFQAQQSRQAEGTGGGGVGEPGASGSPRLSAQQRLSSMGGAAAMSAAAPSDVTGICGTGYYISVSRCAVLCCAVLAPVSTPVGCLKFGKVSQRNSRQGMSCKVSQRISRQVMSCGQELCMHVACE